MLFLKQNTLYILISFLYITFLYGHKSKLLSSTGMFRFKSVISVAIVLLFSAEQARAGLNPFDFERP